MEGKKRKEGDTAATPYVPTDLWVEILSHLPSNDLLTLVGKDWLRLISSTEFIHHHLQRSTAHCNDSKYVLPVASKTDVLCSAASMRISLYNPFLMGSCDGLVLYYDTALHKIAAFNPSLKKLVKLTPNPSIEDDITRRPRLSFSWFGHHPSTGEYVLVLANGSSKGRKTISITFKVYSLSRSVQLSSSTLKLGMEHDPSTLSQRFGTLLHGRLHCSASFITKGNLHKTVIFVYDFQTGDILRMWSPWEKFPVLGVVDGCLCAIQEKTVWMMKEYGVEKSWTKYANLDGWPLAFCPNGDVMIIFKSSSEESLWVSKYRFKERETDHFLKAYTPRFLYDQSIVCIDSLVSPNLLWKEEEVGL